jgi:hypothetical protein
MSRLKFYNIVYLELGYHHIHIKVEDSWKTIFKTRQVIFEWLINSFGLTNAPMAFISMLN